MIFDAIKSLCPTAKFGVTDNDIDKIEWYSMDVVKPSNELILAEVTRLQADYQARQYQRDRAKEYPSFADQFDTLYHGGYDAWKAQIDAIKAKYPKV